jgi:hypothetical protein
VKQEQQEDEITVWSPMRLRSATRTPRCTPRGTKSIPDVTIPQATSGTSASRESVDQEGIFVAILSQGSWDLDMTKSATENLSQRARQVAARGQVFDVEYVNRIVERLDSTGIEAVRRSQVVQLLKDGVRQTLEYWQSCIDRVGNKSSQLPTSLDHHMSEPQVAKPVDIPSLSSSKMLYVDAGHKTSGNAPKFQNWLSKHDSSDTTSDSESTDDHAPSESDYIEHRSSVPAGDLTVQPLESNAGPSTATDWDKAATNMRLYGTRCPKAAFDIFARCTISAWAAAPHPDDTPTEIRQYALLRWRKVPWEQKSVWQKLFEDRHDPAINVYYTGRRLLLSQDLLKVMVPKTRLPAVKLHCRQPQKKHRGSEVGSGQLSEKAASPAEPDAEQSQTGFENAENPSDKDHLVRRGPCPSMFSPSPEHALIYN